MPSFADNRNFIIRKTEKGWSVMVSRCNVCVIEPHKKIKNVTKICKKIESNKKILQDIVGSSSK